MAFPILATKLFAPSPRAALVARPRLLDRLEAASGVRLVLVSAPAGFGKTTLVGAWAATSDVPAAWLSLSEEDGDPKRFLGYVAAALQQLDESLGASLLDTLEAAHLPALDALLTPLLNDLAEHSEPVALVLDDYHLLESPEVDRVLGFLLEHLPAGVRVVMTTREDPPLPLSRFRARAELLELRARDLRFTADEAAEFLDRVMGLSLPGDIVAALEERTEGWIAGLQMAALSLQGRDAAAFVEAFAGSHRFVLDYLAEEVLELQPEDVRDFLLRTSILERLGADLCAAVTGHAEAQAMLERLERSNLFLLPLDDKRRWYRYHHLFAEFLRTRLGSGAHRAELHAKASAWFERRDLFAEAIHHALAAGDFGRAAAIIERIGPELRRRRQDALLFRWLEAFPDDFARNRPILSLDFSNAAFVRGRLELADAHLRNAERYLFGSAPPADMIVDNEAEFRVLPARVLLTRATFAQAEGDPAGAAHYARASLEFLTDDQPLWHGGAAALLGLAHWADGDLDAAYTTFDRAMTMLRDAGYESEMLSGSLPLADIRMAQGRLADALGIYRQALATAEGRGRPHHRVAADIHVGLSELHLERNQLERALEHLAARTAMGERAGLPENRYRSFIAAAGIDAAQGDFESALELLTEAEHHYIRGFFPEVRPISARKIRLRLRRGDLDRALAWVRERGPTLADELAYLREYEHLTFARVLLAQHEQAQSGASLERLAAFLERMLAAARKMRRDGSVLEISILQARVHWAREEPERALAALENALRLAEPEGQVRSFVEDPDMADLLARAQRAQIVPGYVATLLAAFESAPDDDPAVGVSPPPGHAPGLLEPLTKRELEILGLLAEGRSNKEIGRELYRALDTIKGHNRNIFGKLQVRNRTQAVARARELGLL